MKNENSNLTDLTEMFGGVIHKYTSYDGISDGFLHEVYPEKYPKLLLSDDIVSAIQKEASDMRSFDEICIALVLDIVMMSKAKKVQLMRGDFVSLKYTVAGDIWIRANDIGGLTAYTPQEH